MAALQADLFEYLCLEGQQQRRDVELNALQPMVGSDPLTPPQLTRMQEARQQHHDQAAAAQSQADMLRQVSGDVQCAHICGVCKSNRRNSPVRNVPYRFPDLHPVPSTRIFLVPL